MSNACFSSHNPVGHACKTTPRGHFQIPTGGPFIDVGDFARDFKVTYFKYGAKVAYLIRYDGTTEEVSWSCTCPDFEHRDRVNTRTCCKHIQACIDKEMGTTRSGGNYQLFLVEHVQ